MEYQIIKNVGEDLYGDDYKMAIKPANVTIIPTIIEDFAGIVKCVFRDDKNQLVTIIHPSRQSALTFVAEKFGVDMPVVKFIKGVIINGNGKIRTGEATVISR
jgi:hypothetical protein